MNTIDIKKLSKKFEEIIAHVPTWNTSDRIIAICALYNAYYDVNVTPREYYECGSCGCFHKSEFEGDCR